jgi:putative transposase
VRFSIIDANRADWPITVLCRALGVSRAGYYASLSRPLSTRAVEVRRLAVLVREAHKRSRRTSVALASTSSWPRRTACS